MKAKMLMLALPVLTLGPALLSAPIAQAAADEECPVVLIKPIPGMFMGYAPSDRCQSTPVKLVYFPVDQAPPETGLECYKANGNFTCSAWMKTADSTQPLSYRWSSDGSVSAGSSDITSKARRVVTCDSSSSSGVVTVEVISPVGLGSSTSAYVDCGQVNL